LWNGQHGTDGPYDIAEILKKDPTASQNPDNPLWGKTDKFHHWGEPLFGYYSADDEWVLRRHIKMFSMMGVDFLIFDTTNRCTYRNVYYKMLTLMDEYRLAGWDVPKVVFYTNSDPVGTINELYEQLYKLGNFKDLWFMWEGKPMIVCRSEECSQELRDFFTIKESQWPNEPMRENGFPWISFTRPQRVFKDKDGVKEVINVSTAQHPQIFFGDSAMYGEEANWGRGFHDGANDHSEEAVNKGTNFAEQWEYAISQDPRIVFVTGWNEWIAMKLKIAGKAENRPISFVDQASQEFSRDTEPMKGGHFDNYFLQLASYIRQYKGVEASENGVYKEFTGDTKPRCHYGYGDVIYTNKTGRNDIESIKVSNDGVNINFKISVAGGLSSHTDKNWMLLFLNTGKTLNWEGYDFLVNETVFDASTTSLNCSKGASDWDSVGKINYFQEGNTLNIEIPMSMIDVKIGSTIKFKVADNIQEIGNIEEFYLNGDCAPYGRFSYIYEV